MRRLYRLDVTESGEKTAIFVLAEDPAEVIRAVHDHDTGDIDEDSLEPYVEGDKRPRVVTSLSKVEPDLHDFVAWGANDDESTVAEFLETDDEGRQDD